MSNDRLIYLPLGGAGEIGMNAYVYGYGPEGEERLILVDLGVTFPDMDTTPGVNLIFPDIGWLEENADRLEAIFITHAHEDHVGAIGHLWNRLKAPVYARPFTLYHVRRKMEEGGAPVNRARTVSPWPERVEAGPFAVSFMPLSHSIPESSALAIDTPAGRVLHTGDFKIDETPLVGEPFAPDLWAEVVRPGVKVLVCDSTNVLVPHAGRSEASLGPEIEALISNAPGMVAATTFASNVARVRTLALAGAAAGRSICLLGRAMHRMIESATSTGVLTGFPRVIEPEEAQGISRERLMLIVTGSQGERRAVSAQFARGRYRGLTMAEGDMFLFSSKTIPGNERDTIRVMNGFSEMGVDVIDDSSDRYHVSGHANRPDLERIHELVNPGMVIPMHGEHRHLREHVKLARSLGRTAALAANGTMLDLTGEMPEIAGHVETGRTYMDGNIIIGAMDGVVRDRIRLALNGHAIITLTLDENNDPLDGPLVETLGLPKTGVSGASLTDVLRESLRQLLDRMDDGALLDVGTVEDALRREVRRAAVDEIGRRPEVTVVMDRVSI